MKTAISLPDDLFRRADRLAKGSGRSRSELYAAALREYVTRHDPEDLTHQIDAVVGELLDEGAESDRFTEIAARRVLESSEW